MEIDKVHVEGETYFCPECNMVIMNEVTKLKERSIYYDAGKLLVSLSLCWNNRQICQMFDIMAL